MPEPSESAADALDALDPSEALAMLEWQIELGADETILDAPVDRYEAAARAPARPAQAAPGGSGVGAGQGDAGQGGAAAAGAPAPDPRAEVVEAARQAAGAAGDLDGLRAAVSAFEGCDLKKGARSTVFADGDPAARVMIIGEAPGVDEDREGRPFVGRAGKLLDAMFDAIGLSRGAGGAAEALYITNVVPWRPPANRTPDAGEIACMLPFLERHVALAAPELVVVMGNTACQGVLGRQGISRIRGAWSQAWGRPVLPMFHPAYLLRQPHAKRHAWADLLTLRARLDGGA